MNYSGQATHSDLSAEPFVPRSAFGSPEKVYFDSREIWFGSAFVTNSSPAPRNLFSISEAPRNMPLSIGAGHMFNELVPGFSFPMGLREKLGGVFRWPVDVEEVLSPYFETDCEIGGPKMMYWTNVSRFDEPLATSLLPGSGHRWMTHHHMPVFKSMLRVQGMDEEYDLVSDKSIRPNIDSECDLFVETKIYSEWLKTLASAPHLVNHSGNTLSFVKRGDPNITPILCEYHPIDVLHENGISPKLELSGACALTYAMNKYPSIEHNLLAISNEGPRVNVTWMWTTPQRTVQKQLIGRFNIVADLGWYRYCVFVSRLPGYLQQEADKYNLAATRVGQKRVREQSYKAPSTLVTPVVEPSFDFTWGLVNEKPKGVIRPKRGRYCPSL